MGLAGLLDQRVQVGGLQDVARQASELAQRVDGQANSPAGSDEAGAGIMARVNLPQRGHDAQVSQPFSQPPGENAAGFGARDGLE